jgi:hypothetical protein
MDNVKLLFLNARSRMAEAIPGVATNEFYILNEGISEEQARATDWGQPGYSPPSYWHRT